MTRRKKKKVKKPLLNNSILLRAFIFVSAFFILSHTGFAETDLKNSLNEVISGEGEYLPNEPENFSDTAELLGLNKITAKTLKIRIKNGELIRFGNLQIKLEACWKSAPDEKPESAALLEIYENKTGDDREKLFHGWMYASSPSLNPLQHPVYDVSLVNCE